MLNKEIRSLNHLYRITGDKKPIYLLARSSSNVTQWCIIGAFKAKNEYGEMALFIINPFYSSMGSSRSVQLLLSSSTVAKECYDLLGSNMRRFYEYQVNQPGHHNIFSSMFYLGENFFEEYEKFMTSNHKLFSNLFNKYNISRRSNVHEICYGICGDSRNYMLWSLKLFYERGVQYNTLKNIFLWVQNFPQLVKKLNKKTLTAYTSKTDVAGLMDEIMSLTRNKIVNDVIETFNTQQKKLLKESELTDEDKKIFLIFSKLSDQKKNNFIRKVSTIDNKDELMRNMRLVTSFHFNWSKDSFMEYLTNVENLKYEIIVDNGDVMLLKVFDYETIKRLGKMTNWCISKNKSYWNDYLGKRESATQFMLFDFSKKEDDHLSIIGFTMVKNKGITNAHNFINSSLTNRDVIPKLTSYVRSHINVSNIYSILKDNNIDISTIAEFDLPNYSWNKEGLLEFLHRCVVKNNILTLLDSDDKLVLSIEDSGIKYFFGDPYFDNIGSSEASKQHIVFIDFSLSVCDPNKIYFGIVNSYGDSEEYVECIYNGQCISNIDIGFNKVLSDFGLPYDTIRRSDSVSSMLIDGIKTLNMEVINECLKKDKSALREALDWFDCDELTSILVRSLNRYMSFDILRLIDGDNKMLVNYIGTYNVYNVMNNMLYNLVNRGLREMSSILDHIPTETEVEQFYNDQIKSRKVAFAIGSWLVMNEILDRLPEGSKEEVYKSLLGMLSGFTKTLDSSIIKHFVFRMFDDIEIPKNELITELVRVATGLKDEDVDNKICQLMTKSIEFKTAYESNVDKMDSWATNPLQEELFELEGGEEDHAEAEAVGF